MGNEVETVETVSDFIFMGSKITTDGDCSHEIKRRLLLGRKVMTNIDSILKSRDITLLTKIHILNSIFFSPSYVRIWELDHKEGWAPKNWCFWKVVLEKTLESPLDCKEIQSVHLKENQSWIFIGRTGNSNPLATWCKELTPWKWPWFWERLKAGGEWNNREWDGWIASLTQWTWVWANSRW